MTTLTPDDFFAALPPVTCLYCRIVTGRSFEPGRSTVCHKCRWRPDRSEVMEVVSGQRPWARPLSLWSNRGGAMLDSEALAAQDAWGRWQNWVAAFNAAHSGCNCSDTERSNSHERKWDWISKCDVPELEGALAALPAADRTAWKDYQRDLLDRTARAIVEAQFSRAAQVAA